MSELVFPSEEWIAKYREKVNEDEEYAEASEGWGVDFNGDFLFTVTDMPIDELDEDKLPEELKEQLDKYVDGDTGYSLIGLEDGDCTRAELITDPDNYDYGFELKGPYENWKGLIRGEIDPIQGIMSGKFELNGDMQKVMQYNEGAQRLASVSSQVGGVFADEEYGK
ncbi:MAG: SCP2 sterol-binding domain-containing protein [Halobacteria archaeon]|nr:SCP2 sterol-binding domain-containing protein [Halobacteria archaeon]